MKQMLETKLPESNLAFIRLANVKCFLVEIVDKQNKDMFQNDKIIVPPQFEVEWGIVCKMFCTCSTHSILDKKHCNENTLTSSSGWFLESIKYSGS